MARPRSAAVPVRISSLGAVLALCSLSLAACGGAPEPATPKPKPKKVVVKKEEPKEPACNSLADKCEAKEETSIAVPGTELAFHPPPGWLYAKEAEVALAQTPDGGPCLAVASFEKSGNVDDNRAAALDLIVRSLGIKVPEPPKNKPTVDWTKPDAKEAIGDNEISLWQREGGGRATTEGPLLFFSFPASDERTVLGVGYVPKDDDSDADAKIMKALETMKANAGDD